MRAGVYTGLRKFEIQEREVPMPQAGQLRIRVVYCGLCGTDVHKFGGKNGSSVVVPPVVLGHEISGIVDMLGQDVSAFTVGERVTADPNWHCNNCAPCHVGNIHFCKNRVGVVKGLADYICLPQENVYTIPNNVSLLAASFAEPLSCVIHGVDLTRLSSGDKVVIIGFGSIGALIFSLVKLAGAAKIFVIEKEEEKRNLAIKLGADFAFASTEQFLKLSQELDIKRVFECIGLRQTMEDSLKIAGNGGIIMWYGLGNPDDVVSINQYEMFTKELCIKTSFINPFTMGRALALLSDGAIKTDELISKILPLEQLEEEFNTLHWFKKGKVIVKLTEEGVN